jgi:DNA-binding NtrC family response regulator
MTGTPVLFVDDDIISSLESCEVLRENGFDVREVHCGRAAFEAIDQHRPLAALVTDIDLGPGANGFDVARRARAAYPDLTVIFISGMGPVRHRSERGGGSMFIAKPLHPQQIVDALACAIHLEAA